MGEWQDMAIHRKEIKYLNDRGMIPRENGARCVRKSFHIFDLFPNGAIVLNIPYISPFFTSTIIVKANNPALFNTRKRNSAKILTFHFN